MESTMDTRQDRAVLVGLNADCFTREQTATEETLEELEALLETAGGFCTAKILYPCRFLSLILPPHLSPIQEKKGQKDRIAIL